MNDTAIHSLGLGLATRNAKNEIIEVYYPAPLLSPDAALASLLLANCAIQSGENAVSEIDETSARALVLNYLKPNLLDTPSKFSKSTRAKASSSSACYLQTVLLQA